MKLQSFREFAALFAHRFTETRCPQVAGSLAFTTLLALVPLITVTVAVFGNLPGMDELNASLKVFLLENLLPERAGSIITTYALQFSEKAASLTVIGTMLLAITALMLLATIERVFNDIWGVRRARPIFLRITIYWFALTLGPVIMGASVIATGYLVSTSVELSHHLTWVGDLGARLVPPLLLGALFTSLYYAVPNHPVRVPHALAGGVAAAVVFLLMQTAFGIFVAQFPTYTLIYGTFAALPIFLVWLYLSWLVVLLGALTAATLPGFFERRRRIGEFAGSQAWAAVVMMLALARAQHGGGTTAFTALRDQAGLPEYEAEDLLGRLGEAGWVTRTERGDWALIRAPELIRISEVVRRFALDTTIWKAVSNGTLAALGGRLEKGLQSTDETLADVLANTSSSPLRGP